jgi:hypothetical protein
MIASPRSATDNANVLQMWRAEVQIFSCDSGTILGLEVVPDVCSTSAMSSGAAAPACCVCAGFTASGKESVKLPAPCSGVGTRRTIGMLSLSATPTAGEALSCATIRILALRSLR